MSEEEIREIQSYDPWYTIHYKNLQEETPINGHMTWMPSVRAVPADIIKRGFWKGQFSEKVFFNQLYGRHQSHDV